MDVFEKIIERIKKERESAYDKACVLKKLKTERDQMLLEGGKANGLGIALRIILEKKDKQ